LKGSDVSGIVQVTVWRLYWSIWAWYTLSWTVQFNCAKELHEKLNWMFSGTAQVSHQVCQFFLSVLCDWWIKARLSFAVC
jgi:hypothetical protein